MTSKPVAFLLADLGVTKTHSRPHVSNDNPFSEAQFKTLKYRPAFPAHFGSIQDARAHCHGFFAWYNAEHHHAGLGLLTPAEVHHRLAEQRIAARAAVLATAYAAHPERFPAGRPNPPACPLEVWINPPKIPGCVQTSLATPLSRTSPLAHTAAFAQARVNRSLWEARRV
jgi:putative transposase